MEHQFSHDYLVGELKSSASIATQRSVAKSLGVTPQFLGDVINGRREISQRLAKAMGYTRRIVFEKRSERRRAK